MPERTLSMADAVGPVYEVAIQMSAECLRSMLISHTVAKSEGRCQRNVEALLKHERSMPM